MTDSDLPGAGSPRKWSRPLRLALDSIVAVLTDAYVMTRDPAAGSWSGDRPLHGERARGVFYGIVFPARLSPQVCRQRTFVERPGSGAKISGVLR